MTLDFKNIDLNNRPQILLRNLDGVAFGTLGSAFNIQTNFKFNEISELTFEVPAYDNGEKTPFYDEIKSMTIIDFKDYGQFLLYSAVVKSDGIREVKSCTCYSLEYEMSYKQFFVEKGTYNFWNPVSPKGTILGMILETIPYWTIGTVDPKLIGKYRTFEANNINVFDFIKNTAQQTYSCVFTFDTYNRTLNVMDVSSFVPTAPVYLSTYNLIKEIEITEETENILTCLEAYGADDVTIRSVNPIGTNKIYNLDYYMNETNLSASIISKWNTWETLLENRQLPYYNLKIEESNQSARFLTEDAVLTDMRADLKRLENLQAVSIQYLGEHPNSPTEQAKLDKTNDDIVIQKSNIKTQENYLDDIQSELNSIQAELAIINNELAFWNTFTQDEIMSFSKYIKESSIQESSFVVSKVKNYNSADVSSKHSDSEFHISNSTIISIPNEKNKEIYSMIGGQLTCPCGDSTTTANIVRGSMERKTDGAFVFTAHLNRGTINMISFPSGNISATGNCGSIAMSDTSLSFTAPSARVYFTQNVTEYESRSVQFDLYEYAKQCLKSASVPTYTFNVKPANFLALEDFVMFKDNFSLGNKVYLDIGDNKVLQPIVIGVSINFEDFSSFSIEFSNSYKSNDAEFKLVDQIQQSVSMGKTLDSSKYSYSSWVDSGASSSVKDFMDSALDVGKNEILSSTGQAISWDENGMRFRKWNTNKTDYEPEQIWMINNSIAMTDNNWGTVKTAIGKFTDSKHGTVWGINADLLAGRKIIGNDFSFACPSVDGKTMQFIFDANGAQLNNSKMYLQCDGGGKISIDPQYGILLGNDALYTIDDNGNPIMNETNANMWMDSDGIIHSKGMLATGGMIKGGEIYIGGLETATNCKFGVDKLGNIIGIETANGLAKIDKDGKVSFSNDVSISGNLTLSGNINLSQGHITWGNNAPTKYQFSIDGVSWHDTMQSTDKYRRDSIDGGTTWGAAYQFVGTDGRNGSDGSDANVPSWVKSMTSTYINNQWVISPNIAGGNITALNKMEATCDFHVGNNIYLGDVNNDGRSIIFSSNASITNTPGTGELSLSAFGNIVFDTRYTVDFSNAESINWGNNTPVAVFG